MDINQYIPARIRFLQGQKSDALKLADRIDAAIAELMNMVQPVPEPKPSITTTVVIGPSETAKPATVARKRK